MTSSRLPFALDEIRKFGKADHVVFSTSAAGAASFPGGDREIVDSREIDLVVPSFEEVFHLARHRSRFAGRTALFAPSFEALVMLHDKARFVELARHLGLRVPRDCGFVPVIDGDRSVAERVTTDAGLHVRFVIREPMAPIARGAAPIDRRLMRSMARVAVGMARVAVKAALLLVAGGAGGRLGFWTMRRMTGAAVAAPRVRIRLELVARAAGLRGRDRSRVWLVA